MASTVYVFFLFLYVARAEFSGISMVTKTLDQCNKDADMFSCLKVKAVKLLDRAMTVDALPVTDYLTISRDPLASAPLTSAPLAPPSRDPKALDELLADRLVRYLQSRTINFKLPSAEVEGRKKKKGGLALLLVGGAWGVMLLKMAVAAIALIAGKALLVGKIALLLAGILGLKALLTHQGEKHAAQVIYAEPEVHHGGWGRTGSVAESAHDIAYKNQRSISP